MAYDISKWSNYDYTNNGYNSALWSDSEGNQDYTTFLWDLLTFKSLVGAATNGINNYSMSWNEYGQKWATYGSTLGNWFTSFVDIWKDDGNVANKLIKSVIQVVAPAINATGLAVSEASSFISRNLENGNISDLEDAYVNTFYGTTLSYGESLADTVGDILDKVSSIGGNNSYIASVITNGMKLFLDGGLRTYQNGVDETTFGQLMEASWSKNSSESCFRNLINSGKVIFTNTTPFDSGDDSNNLYGNMILGAPPIFTNITDPKNRSLSETFIRDSKFLTLTPGFPKYNGNNLLLKQSENQYNQTTDANSMLSYLLRNGLDATMLRKDKRYYTFKTDYDEYYRYLETMLNTLYIKLGLSKTEDNNYNIFTFFTHDGDSETLKPQYSKSFGFFVNPQGVLTESFSNTMTSYGQSYAGEVNSASETYQQLLYTTGYGTGGTARNAAAKVAKAAALTQNMKSWVSSVASNVIGVWAGDGGVASKAIRSIPAAITDARKFLVETDQGASLESFATTNGMKIVYPELWSDSTYTRSITINFEFISPYGDPASIFHYVLAPFSALFCYACPRQAADNGFVSPFFVRADIPGLFTSDLALISDFTWMRGGNSDLWTKDGLPRAISGSFTIQDLYPFLAMTKRLSFLSANPNYTTFLDNMASLHVINSNDTDEALNDYWKELLTRVSGTKQDDSGLWNKYNSNRAKANNDYANNTKTNRLNVSKISWMKN